MRPRCVSGAALGCWDGLHRHVALVMLAYSFLILQSLLPHPTLSQDGDLFPLSSLRTRPDAARRPPPSAWSWSGSSRIWSSGCSRPTRSRPFGLAESNEVVLASALFHTRSR